tara:strand:- start:241 stop:492 length:252 start_codon:yes stop_codon:yes gene_type:complete
MIIPIKCFTCGKVLADKYQYYLSNVRRLKLEDDNYNEGDDEADNIVYLTNENVNKSPEGIVLDKLKLTRMCCRRHMITHVDIN